MNNYTINRQQRVNSIILAFFFTADMLTKILSSLIIINNNLILIYLTIFFIGLLVNGYSKGIKVKRGYFISFIIFFTMLLISVFRVPDPTYTIQYMFSFILYYLLIGFNLQFDYSGQLIFKYINYINFIFTFYILFSIIPSYNSMTLNVDFTMDLSYTTLIGIFSFFMYFFLSRIKIKENKLFFILSLLCVVVEMYFLLVISYNRGALLSLFIFGLIFLVRLFKNLKLRLVTSSIIIVICYSVYTNLLYILNFLNDIMLHTFNMNLNWLSKTTYLVSTQTFTSGRQTLFNDAKESFINSPIFGNGIGEFASRHNGQYPHNIFLEALTDQGIIFTILLSFFVLYIIIAILLKEYSDFLLLIVFLFCLSLPRLMMSSTIWNSSFFWSLVVLFFTTKKMRFTVSGK